jgi:hypothetical protein
MILIDGPAVTDRPDHSPFLAGGNMGSQTARLDTLHDGVYLILGSTNTHND